MDIEIVSKRENPLLNRTEVYFKVEHPNEKTPKRDAVRGKVAEALKVRREQVVIDYMKSEFGMPVTKGYAKVYKKPEDIEKIEREHIKKRNAVKKEESDNKEGGE
jgi:small subunit ribosomal protein S24e